MVMGLVKVIYNKYFLEIVQSCFSSKVYTGTFIRPVLVKNIISASCVNKWIFSSRKILRC